jgi:hypothetical protein
MTRERQKARLTDLSTDEVASEIDIENVPERVVITKANGAPAHVIDTYLDVGNAYNYAGTPVGCPKLTPDMKATLHMINSILTHLNMPKLNVIYAYQSVSDLPIMFVATNQDTSAAWVIAGVERNRTSSLYIKALSFFTSSLKKMGQPELEVQEKLIKYKQIQP